MGMNGSIDSFRVGVARRFEMSAPSTAGAQAQVEIGEILHQPGRFQKSFWTREGVSEILPRYQVKGKTW